MIEAKLANIFTLKVVKSSLYVMLAGDADNLKNFLINLAISIFLGSSQV